jgi:hypothetical protein
MSISPLGRKRNATSSLVANSNWGRAGRRSSGWFAFRPSDSVDSFAQTISTPKSHLERDHNPSLTLRALIKRVVN